MRVVLDSMAHLLVMAAIVTTALFVPVAALLVLLSFAVLRVGLLDFVTFGGRLGALLGLLAWWAIFFVPALVYSAYVMPWQPREPLG